MMNLTIDAIYELPEQLELEDKWILSKLNTAHPRGHGEHGGTMSWASPSSKIYDFIWDTYCDWYIELTKARLHGEDEEAKLSRPRTCCAMC